MMNYYPSGMSRADLQYLGEIPSRYADEAPEFLKSEYNECIR